MGSYSDFTFYGDIVGRSDKAVKINDGTKEVWLPLSQIREEIPPEPRNPNGATKFVIPEWLAYKNGLM